MRMWFVDPRLMCRQHLLGEHRELHAIVGAIIHGIGIDGYRNLLEVHNVRTRHEKIVKETRRRSYRHESPLPKFEEVVFGEVDREESLKELYCRCPKCRDRILPANESDT